jgi:hypothetical protein
MATVARSLARLCESCWSQCPISEVAKIHEKSRPPHLADVEGAQSHDFSRGGIGQFTEASKTCVGMDL